MDFLNFDGLDDHQANKLKDLLHPSNLSSEIEFPWSNYDHKSNFIKTGQESSLNVHAPAFETPKSRILLLKENHYSPEYNNGSNPKVSSDSSYFFPAEKESKVNGIEMPDSTIDDSHLYTTESSRPVNGDSTKTQTAIPASTFKLNPTVSCFVPQSIRTYIQPTPDNGAKLEVNPPCGSDCELPPLSSEPASKDNAHTTTTQNGNDIPHEPGDNSELLNLCLKDNPSVATDDTQQNGVSSTSESVSPTSSTVTTASIDSPVTNSMPVRRSWAQIVSSGQSSSSKVPLEKPLVESDNKIKASDKEVQNLCIEEDKVALILGKHLHELVLDFRQVLLQPRGLINRRNWCYINATLQALLASSPFYTMLRNLPLGPAVERGKSSTPVIDSMVKVSYEFSCLESAQEELQAGAPFQPDFIYDMLRDLKSDCLKGQQEDAEEFLSLILNGMHEEMVKIIKNYEEKNCICSAEEEIKENGDLSENEEEWQVIGSKHKGMVTRKVVEHRTPISDLLGGQIKSLLTTSGSKTSASIQPFFTLQLDIQSENVNSVSEALKEMTLKEPIQGYTCAKTKQEVEAYSHISLQKLPPVLILHLKRFVYNKNGGCKKVMKKTDYPLELELGRELFSSDVKKSQRNRTYKLFAVMYHDGEEAIKGHYISDVYNHGCQSWIRCDDRQITAVTEAQVFSHTPPRVPYLLFYQESPYCSM